ncbi:MAG: hypothetical protein RLZZ553_339 [Verrucomicrobiota bacterium]|jgi:uncharacterized protein (DUF1800 family)
MRSTDESNFAMLPKAENQWTWEEAAHLLNRAGFGGNLQEISQLHAMGRYKAVDFLTNPTESIDFLPAPEWSTPEKRQEAARKRFAEIRDSRKNMQGMTAEEADRKRREIAQKFQQLERRQGLEAQGWWLDRMFRSEAPLREKMTLFWHDHFATSVQKVKEPALLFDQNVTFRKHALGNFKKLTLAMAQDPAMMLYLDLQTSKKGKPNENFAREVMELFTLGQGNYTEEDIRQAARAFTGYDINRLIGTVSHNKRNWDDGVKSFLGQQGKFDGNDIIDVIFQQPQAARYVSLKLWEYFAYENPPEAAVDDLAKTLREANFELVPLLREIFLSKEFYSADCMSNQIKSPVQFFIQMLKQLEVPSLPKAYALYVQSQLGQILFAPPNVAGWDWGKAWINTNTLLTRYQISGFLCKGTDEKSPAREMDRVMGFGNGLQRMAEMSWKGPDYDALVPRAKRENIEVMVDSLIQRLFQRNLSGNVREQFIAYAAEKKGVVFTNQEVAELLHLMMSTPHYQLT